MTLLERLIYLSGAPMPLAEAYDSLTKVTYRGHIYATPIYSNPTHSDMTALLRVANDMNLESPRFRFLADNRTKTLYVSVSEMSHEKMVTAIGIDDNDDYEELYPGKADYDKIEKKLVFSDVSEFMMDPFTVHQTKKMISDRYKWLEKYFVDKKFIDRNSDGRKK